MTAEALQGLPVPERIVLATDLGSHGDRALDRAAQLAGEWGAELHIVHALRDGADGWWPDAAGRAEAAAVARADLARAQIRRDLGHRQPAPHIHVHAGEPADVVLETAARIGAGLLVLGARGPGFAGIRLASTTAQLLRRAPQSVLVVKARPHEPYARILVGTDFTAESRLGLETAAAWFPAAGFALMHALDIPWRSLLLEAGREDAFASMERETMASFVAGAQLPAEVRARLHTHVEYGHPERMLREHGLANDVDLTVVGALTRGLAFQVLVGGNAGRIVQAVPGDVLVVRATA